ncbi:unnamed protein product [Durusdinium trenchii]|uniref:Uncharacterized protein n=2 Tax=Durusdinium trenchii TaxID=1381693 RepID=A0ABP0IBR4_9DINO
MNPAAPEFIPSQVSIPPAWHPQQPCFQWRNASLRELRRLEEDSAKRLQRCWRRWCVKKGVMMGAQMGATAQKTLLSLEVTTPKAVEEPSLKAAKERRRRPAHRHESWQAWMTWDDSWWGERHSSWNSNWPGPWEASTSKPRREVHWVPKNRNRSGKGHSRVDTTDPEDCSHRSAWSRRVEASSTLRGRSQPPRGHTRNRNQDWSDAQAFPRATWRKKSAPPIGSGDSSRAMPSAQQLQVFFEGTANTIEPLTTQIGLFFMLTDAFDVSGGSLGGAPLEQPRKMAFDGCGVTDGFCGTICAKGLRRQCRMVRRQVDSLLAELKNNTAEQSKLRVNAVGLSRGGIACSYLAQEMADIPASSCELSLLLFDPVPGDLLTVAQLDFFRLTNTSASGDMSNCACLSRVLALYPYEPLPAILCHAPILCRYPPHCMVEEEVTLGCHQGALQIHDLRGPVIDLASAMCFLRIRRWLMECGTPLDHNHVDCTVKVKDLEAFCLRKCNAEVKRLSPSSRCSHTALSCWGATIVRHKPDRGVQFLNEQHRLLASAGSDEKWLLEIRTDKAPFPSGLLCLLALVAVLVIWPLLFQS